jgi:hypothetical protein|tara:strand:+ start:1675 stop:1935 length:261 start_codon:yes stop_codon:yes gene_type:complete
MDDIKTLEEFLEENFMTPTKFADEIETLVKYHDVNYIEAIVEFCDMNSIEIETVSKLISKPLKEKIKYEAQKLNYIKKTSRGVLPI